jgi:UV excision repair protein RAD23
VAVPQQAPAGMTDEQKQKVESLSQMGFQKEECENALKAAFWFEDRAIDYLLNGIPADVMDSIAQGHSELQAQAPPQQVGQQQSTQGQGRLGQEGDPLAGIPPEILAQINGLTQNPQFMELRNYARQNPEMVLPQIAAMIQQNNPQLWAFFEQDTALFVSLILGAPSGQQGQQGQQAQAENPNEIRLSQSDNDAVKRLEAFGFEQYACFEAYSVCDKNEEMALSMLFDNADKAQNQPPAQP